MRFLPRRTNEIPRIRPRKQQSRPKVGQVVPKGSPRGAKGCPNQSQNFKKLPTYKLISNTGPRHKPIFKIGVKLPNTKYFIATGKSKKEAEQNAAMECLKTINKK